MSKRTSLAFWIVAIPFFALCTACGIASIYFAAAPDQAVFFGFGNFAVSAVRHTDNNNTSLLSSQHMPIILGLGIDYCGAEQRNEVIYNLTGVSVAYWNCPP
jgi:hypothetical protein